MAHPPLPPDPPPFQWRKPPSPVARWTRRILVTSGLGALTGYLIHPWALGSRRRDLITALHSIQRRLQSRPSRTASSHSLPIDPADPQVIAYSAMLGTLGLRHITPMEIIRPHYKQRGPIANTLPPPELWPYIHPTLRIADKLRHQLGVPLRAIVSAYRSPSYNAACPGAAPQSHHTRNQALDLVFDCDPALVVAAATALRDQGHFTGGIGRYPTFTHIDTRGVKADW